jgi:hypothetical protein
MKFIAALLVPHRASARPITKLLATGAILMAGIASAGSALAQTAAQTSAPKPETPAAPDAYVYATVGFDKIKPEMVLETTSGTVTGTYDATQSEAELDAIYRTGTYGITSGTLEGEFSGNTLSGYWYETAYNAGLQTYCETERKGTNIYGRFVLKFSADRKSFTGLRTGCDATPDPVDHKWETWTGKLIRRQPAAPKAAAVKGSDGAYVAGTRSASPTAGPGSNLARRLADSAARAAEEEAKAKADEKARKVTRGLLDRIF